MIVQRGIMINIGLNYCICVKGTTVEGIEVGKVYEYSHYPICELGDGATYFIVYNDRKSSLPCKYDYFHEHFSEICQ